MTDSIPQEQAQAMLKWLNQNRETLLNLYKDQYIAYNENGILAHGETLDSVLKEAEATGQLFSIYLVPRKRYSIQILWFK